MMIRIMAMLIMAETYRNCNGHDRYNKDDNDNTAKCKSTTTSNSELGKDFKIVRYKPTIRKKNKN